MQSSWATASQTGESLQERGSRRRKLAAMAGSVYRAGVAAASEIRDQYNSTRVRNYDLEDKHVSIPGSFPDVAICVQGDEQMVLFPTYGKRHVRQTRGIREAQPLSASQASMSNEEYWHHEWTRNEDAKAIVDVDVRGWVYSPQKGPMTRKNRILIGLARRLSGISAPNPGTQGMDPSMQSLHEQHEEMREQQRISKEAEEIERRGQGEKDVANRGGYSEPPKDDQSDPETVSSHPPRSPSSFSRRASKSAPSSPTLSPRPSWGASGATELTDAELVVANANLMARVGPFLTNPLVQLPITVFFYDDEQSQSRTVMTNDAGHFNLRAALDFAPTHVRVLANERLSAVDPVQIIERKGVSLISDIDDTIKRSNISLGAREIFRNTFIRDLTDLHVDGVQDWYNSLYRMDVRFHYCSNSPWQLFPVLATFFKGAGLPPGSLHLKQYSGMLQGIFEPVAERKKGTLERLMTDFPERKFLLVGDSGEADLEVYTELAVTFPGRVLAVFIRDVTTPEQTGYFDTGFDPAGVKRQPTGAKTWSSRANSGDQPSNRPALPSRVASEPVQPEGPVMGTLIDLSDEPEPMSLNESQGLSNIKQGVPVKAPTSALDLLAKKPPPARPAKPKALRGMPSDPSLSVGVETLNLADSGKPPALPPRGTNTSGSRVPSGTNSSNNSGTPHPLTQMQNSSDMRSNTSLPKTRDGMGRGSIAAGNDAKQPPPPPPPRRRLTPTSTLLSLSPRLRAQHRRSRSIPEMDPLEALTPLSSSSPPQHASTSSPAVSLAGRPPSGGPGPLPPGRTGSGGTSSNTSPLPSPVNKKVDLWRRRLQRAQETLDQLEVRLYTWRRGDDVSLEALEIVREAMRMLKEGRR